MLSSRQRYAVVALVAVWVCGGQSQRSCPGTTLSIITFVPCGRMQNGFEDRSTSSFNAGCDFLVKSAVQLAANHYTSLSANVAVNLTLSAVRRTVPLLQIIGAAAESGIHGIIGPQTLSQSYLITPVITNQLQIPSVTYIHSEEDVVDSELYYRTLPSDSYIVDALVSLLDHLQWYGIAVLSTNEDEYLKQFEMFVSTFSSYVKEETDDLVDSMLIKTFTNEEQLQHSLEHVVDSGINIIVAFVGKQFAAHVMCKASRAGLTASEYVWVLPSYTDPGWWKVSSNDCVRGDGLRCNNCTHSELKNALQSTLFITPSKYPPFTQSNQDQNE